MTWYNGMPGEDWVAFYDKAKTTNSYGEAVQSETLIGSGLCVVIPDDVISHRKKDGTLVTDDIYIHYPNTIDIHPLRSFAVWGGDKYNILWIQVGNLTGTNYARGMRIVR